MARSPLMRTTDKVLYSDNVQNESDEDIKTAVEGIRMGFVPMVHWLNFEKQITSDGRCEEIMGEARKRGLIE